MRRSNHENIDVLMLIGLVTEGEEGEEGKSHSKVGTRWVRQLWRYLLKIVLLKVSEKVKVQDI